MPTAKMSVPCARAAAATATGSPTPLCCPSVTSTRTSWTPARPLASRVLCASARPAAMSVPPPSGAMPLMPLSAAVLLGVSATATRALVANMTTPICVAVGPKLNELTILTRTTSPEPNSVASMLPDSSRTSMMSNGVVHCGAGSAASAASGERPAGAAMIAKAMATRTAPAAKPANRARCREPGWLSVTDRPVLDRRRRGARRTVALPLNAQCGVMLRVWAGVYNRAGAGGVKERR